MKKFIVVTSLILFSFRVFAVSASAQAGRSYSYPAIYFTFRVNQDSTVDVEEQENFKFVGEYHEGWRSLLLNKVDDITDISVIDGESNLPLHFVNSELDKTNPSSWGNYTVVSKSGEKNVI